MRALTRSQRAPIPWDRVALTAVGITAPVGLALLFAPTNDAVIGAGALASMGALVASAMDLGSAGIERVHRMALASMMATIGFGIGTAVHGHVVATLVAVIVAALLSGISGAISATASKSAVYFLMYTVTAANADFGLSSPWMAPLIFFAGAAWRLLLTMAAAAYEGREFAPERRAVARVYDAIVAQLSAGSAAGRTAAGDALTGALNDAYDVLVAARTELAAHDRRWQTLVAVLNASAPVVDAAIAAAEDERDVDAEVLDYLRGVAAWVSNPARPAPSAPHASGGDPALATSIAHVAHVVSGVSARASGPVGDGTDLALPQAPTVIGRLRGAGRALTSGTELWNSILRLVLCIAVAQALCAAWQLERPYLVMLTVAQVMKPDFGSIFGRAVQRGVGTLIGVAIGALAVAVIPRDGWQILVILILAASMPIVMPRNYGLYSIVTTPLAVLLVELHVSDSSSLVEARLLDTLLGCAIVLVLGYLPWPQTWHAPRHLAVPVAALAHAISVYARVALSQPDDPDRSTLRRGVYRRISDLRTTVAKALAEPPAISAASASWLPEVAALERVTDAVTAAATEAEASGAAQDAEAVDAVASALDDLADAITARRRPVDVELPGGVLPAVAGDLATARSALIAQQVGAERRVKGG
ncbi:FUSC family protein [Agromyces atrinae]|nr:FUSC family protein [Agromyces atrinae]NYD67672.1 putative membrane protein YccC [Agromyces atrinae]